MVRVHSPEPLVVVDAALGLEPGVAVYEGEPSPGWSTVSTHGIPPLLVHRLLADAARRVVYLLLGIEKVELGAPLSVGAAGALSEIIGCDASGERG